MGVDTSKRATLLGMAGAAGTLGLAGAAPAKAKDWAKVPEGRKLNADLVLQIHVKLGETEDMGMTAEGHRINYPIIGGRFSGRDIGGNTFKGKVIPGGADMSVERSDGVTIINALYRLRTDDGATIIIDNAGIWRPSESGLKKLKSGEKLLASDYYCLTTPKFKTSSGKYNWLTQNIFVGTIDDVGDDAVLIGCYLMNQVV